MPASTGPSTTVDHSSALKSAFYIISAPLVVCGWAPRPASCPSQPTQEVTMIVMFSARRLKPGAWEQFRRAWDPGDSKPPGFQRAYHARNIRDEDEIISFGLFDMSEQDYRRWREEA